MSWVYVYIVECTDDDGLGFFVYVYYLFSTVVVWRVRVARLFYFVVGLCGMLCGVCVGVRLSCMCMYWGYGIGGGVF